MTLEMTLEDLAWPNNWLGSVCSPILYNDAYRAGRREGFNEALTTVKKALDNWPWLSIDSDIDRALEALVNRKMEKEREGLRRTVGALVALLEQEGLEAPELDAVKRLLPRGKVGNGGGNSK